MTDYNSQRQKSREAISALNGAIDGLNIAKRTTPANPVFGPVVLLLTMIRVSSLSLRDETFQAHA